jgi:ABC-type amino acid transport substrate-binding protein
MNLADDTVDGTDLEGAARGPARLVLVASFLAVPLAAGAADLDAILARGHLRVAAVATTGPDEFFSLTASRPGFDREILESFAKLQRVKLQVVPVASWDALVPTLRDDGADVVAGRFTATDARRKQIDFTIEVFPTRNAVVSRKPHRVVQTLEELRAERVGTVKGTSLAEAVAAARVPAENVDDSIATGSLPDALKQGRITAAVLGLESAVTAQRDDPEIQIGLFLGQPGSLAYGVRKGDEKLLAALNQFLENVRHTPTWSRLVVKYFGESGLDILKRARSE